MFALHIPEEGGLSSEEAILQFLLQAAVPTAHAAVHRHLARSPGGGSERIGWASSGCCAGRRGPSPGSTARAHSLRGPVSYRARRSRHWPARFLTLGPAWLRRLGNLFLSRSAAGGCEYGVRPASLLGSLVLCGFMSSAPAPSLRPVRLAPS